MRTRGIPERGSGGANRKRCRRRRRSRRTRGRIAGELRAAATTTAGVRRPVTSRRHHRHCRRAQLLRLRVCCCCCRRAQLVPAHQPILRTGCPKTRPALRVFARREPRVRGERAEHRRAVVPRAHGGGRGGYARRGSARLRDHASRRERPSALPELCAERSSGEGGPSCPPTPPARAIAIHFAAASSTQ